MKALFLLIALLFSLTANAQTAPFKGANTILIASSDSSAAALKKLARVLVAQGYAIDKLDTDLGYLTTQGKSFGQITPAVFTYKAVASSQDKGSQLKLTGEYTVPFGMRTLTSSMHWYKGNLTQDKACFMEAEKAARAYPGGLITYGVE